MPHSTYKKVLAYDVTTNYPHEFAAKLLYLYMRVLKKSKHCTFYSNLCQIMMLGAKTKSLMKNDFNQLLTNGVQKVVGVKIITFCNFEKKI